MTDQAQTTATVAAPAKKTASKKASAKKSPKKKAAKKTTAKKAPRAKKEGLRKPQVRILAALAKSSKGLSRAEIAEKASVDLAMLNSYIGAHDDKVRAKNDAKVCPSLLTLGFVKPAPVESDTERGARYVITASGRKALDAAK